MEPISGRWAVASGGIPYPSTLYMRAFVIVTVNLRYLTHAFSRSFPKEESCTYSEKLGLSFKFELNQSLLVNF